jgi:hypothetical protein
MIFRGTRLIAAAWWLVAVTLAGSALAATGGVAEGGIGGTGMPAMRGGIGGTGLLPNDEATRQGLAGKVLFILGQVEAENHGQTRLLSKGDAVRVGDTLKSGSQASLQLRMEDGGMIVLRPQSRLLIRSFAYHGIQDGTEHIALELTAGGFRAVTGNIGKVHKENYVISTPNATVGIRGTDHETVFVGKAAPGEATVVEPGTYDHVISGATLLQSEQGKVLVKPTQTGFAPLTGIAPVIVRRPLPIFGVTPGRSEEHGAHEHNLVSPGYEATNNEGNVASGTEQQQDKVTQSERLANSGIDLNTLETDSSPAAGGSGVVGAHMAAGLLTAGSARTGVSGNEIATEDGFPTSYSNDATGFNYLANDAPPLQSGVATVDGVSVTWGIYAGGVAFTTSGQAVAVNYHPFAFTNGGVTPSSVVSSIGGTASFSSIAGGTQPVTETGAIGGSVSLNVGVNLSAGTLTSYNLAVTDASSRSWAGTLSSPVSLSAFSNGIPLSVTCSCAGVASGSAAGMLVGQTARGLISSYLMSTTAGPAVAGAVVLSR